MDVHVDYIIVPEVYRGESTIRLSNGRPSRRVGNVNVVTCDEANCGEVAVATATAEHKRSKLRDSL